MGAITMMKYDFGSSKFENWIIAESEFSPKTLGKAESVMVLGNGYLGLRSSTDEPYLGETRDLLVAGTYNKFGAEEVTEIPNAADVTRLDIQIDDERFSLEFGQTADYVRYLNLKTAELFRSFIWTSPKGKAIRFEFRRFVSLVDLHLIAVKFQVTPQDAEIRFSLDSGIDIRMTNSGSQHFSDGERRIYDRSFIQQTQTTTQSMIDFVLTTVNKLFLGGVEVEGIGVMEMDRRRVWMHYDISIAAGQTLTLEKISTVWTSRDEEAMTHRQTLPQLQMTALEHIREASTLGYDALHQESALAWEKQVWDFYDIGIDSERPFDLLAVRFAIYHLVVMTPAHDDRMGVAAKGLSGEGYKGHCFWDTEVFILPFYIYSRPEVARSLLKYRYHGLVGAHRKAKENGYRGAMYPWEMAWPTDGEVTPVWGAVDIVTGKQTKIWSGFIEQHITADIAYAVWLYRQVTGDETFMRDYGYEMVIDTAIFWLSRLEYVEELDRYEITDVVGPDEYKEHASNNAFTNYMAHFNIELALKYVQELRQSDTTLYNRLDAKLNTAELLKEAKEKLPRIYLPAINDDGLIPQDDRYLHLKSIDLTPYKIREKVGTLFYEYNLEQVNQIQVSKQADVVILLYLLGHKFDSATIKKNFEYYEARTLHDSSLSLSTHAILANDLGYEEMAYELFERASRIDLGSNMKSSNDGIHAASIGGIWQTVVLGFGGVRTVDGVLRMNPRLPRHWHRMTFSLQWQGDRIHFEISTTAIQITPTEGKCLEIVIQNQPHQIRSKTSVPLNT